MRRVSLRVFDVFHDCSDHVAHMGSILWFMCARSPSEEVGGEGEKERQERVCEEAVREMLSDFRVHSFCNEVADVIGVTPERVVRVVLLSNDGGHLFHGVKDFRARDAVRTMGIQPVTPESRASHWTSGMALFGDPKGNNAIDRFFNATFFNYAHTAQGRPAVDGTHMTITMTRVDVLRLCDPQFVFHPNAECTVCATVPRDAFHLLSIRAPQGDATSTQRRMFETLEEVLFHGYALGGETVVDVSEESGTCQSPL